MKVSGLSKSRKWNSLVLSAKVKNGEQVINPPSWYFTYTLRTKPQTNEKGDWYGWDISRSNPVTPDIYAEGKAFNASVKKGDVEVNYEQEDTGSEKNRWRKSLLNRLGASAPFFTWKRIKNYRRSLMV